MTGIINLVGGIEIYLMGFWSFGLLALRVAIGAIFLVHGKSKFATWKTQPGAPAAPMANIMRFLAIAETVGGTAMFLGFMTQFAAIGLAIIMIGAIYFKIEKWKVSFVSQNGTG